ncbi:Short chain dehydrogenase sol3 [Apiospora phragmitis]|uniref:Short chain dehydrogenase sol3 n=1 Tax=Apiospora phragmitis TaxID=2905665 RepID=A0ABR1W2U1_9PEZI
MGFLHSQLLETRKLPYPEGSQAGKTVVITGSNTGLGKEAARHFARLGASRLILAVRNVESGEAAMRDILESTKPDNTVIQVWQLDMASYAGVKSFAARVEAELDRIDIFIENAGLAKTKWSTAEDNETQITVNVVSTMLLAALVLPKLRQVAAAFGIRPTLTLTSSGAHAHTKLPHAARPGNVFATLNDQVFAEAHWAEQYPASKLLPVFHVRSIAERRPATGANGYPVTINLASPGLCESGLAREAKGVQALAFGVMKTVLARTTEQGSRTIFHAATQGPETHGQYMNDCKIGEPSETVTTGKELQDRLWEELMVKLEKIQPGVTKNF